MICAYRTDEIRAAEEPLLAAGVPLMRQAARAVACVVIRELKECYGQASGRRVVALVGSGNNGGDALFALSFLRSRGVHCTALLAFPDSTHADGLAAARTAGVHIVEASIEAVSEQVQRADVILDGLLGIGARGALREPLASIIEAVNEIATSRKKAAAKNAATKNEGTRNSVQPPVCIAVDIPTGISADDGTLPSEAFRADITVTMGAAKPGLLLDPARRYAGDVRIVDLSFPLPDEPALIVLEDGDIAQLWRTPGATSHKYARGVVGMMTGSLTYPGAAILSVGGALGAGAGMVRFAGPQRLARLVLGTHPEVVTTRGRVQAWVLGSGVDMDDEQAAAEVARRLHEAMIENRPVVLDVNGSYHEPAELRALMEKLTGEEIDESFGLFPPFYTDCGKNIHFGKRVFVNSGCRFQDQGGIWIGDDALIGHNAVLATLNHNADPAKRANLIPAPIHIGNKVWLGANVTVLPGVTIGDGAIIKMTCSLISSVSLLRRRTRTLSGAAYVASRALHSSSVYLGFSSIE